MQRKDKLLNLLLFVWWKCDRWRRFQCEQRFTSEEFEWKYECYAIYFSRRGIPMNRAQKMIITAKVFQLTPCLDFGPFRKLLKFCKHCNYFHLHPTKITNRPKKCPFFPKVCSSNGWSRPVCRCMEYKYVHICLLNLPSRLKFLSNVESRKIVLEKS